MDLFKQKSMKMEKFTIVKLSKLIEELQQTLKEEGDIDCYNPLYYIEEDKNGKNFIAF